MSRIRRVRELQFVRRMQNKLRRTHNYLFDIDYINLSTDTLTTESTESRFQSSECIIIRSSLQMPTPNCSSAVQFDKSLFLEIVRHLTRDV